MMYALVALVGITFDEEHLAVERLEHLRSDHIEDHAKIQLHAQSYHV